jgi:hypothetical protein
VSYASGHHYRNRDARDPRVSIVFLGRSNFLADSAFSFSVGRYELAHYRWQCSQSEQVEDRKSMTRKFRERTALQLYLLVDEYSANISISVLAGSLAPSEL